MNAKCRRWNLNRLGGSALTKRETVGRGQLMRLASKILMSFMTIKSYHLYRLCQYGI